MKSLSASQGTRLRGVVMMMTIMAMLVASIMPVADERASAQTSEWYPPQTVYIPETGHTLDRLFLDLWRNAGGASAFGYPITPEITQDNGHVVQYLQYARFEYWPEGDANGNTVLLGKLGEELRPVTVQRSLNSASNVSAPSSLVTSSHQIRAWLPVDQERVDLERDDVLYVEATQHTITGGFLSYWYNSGAEAYLGNPLTEEYSIGDVTYQVFERGQLKWAPGDGVYMTPVGEILAKKYGLDTAPMAQGDVPTYDEMLFVPPPEPTPEPTLEPLQAIEAAEPTGEVWIDIDLSFEYMRVYKGDTVVLETYISSGKPGFETPPGTFYINSKLEEQDMEGVLGGEYYNVPSVPWVMYFTNEGHAIHGAYWHNNFGTPMSHGCINVPVDLSQVVYDMSPIGTRVEIHW